MPYNKFFKTYYVNNQKKKTRWNSMLKFDYEIQYLGLDKGYMLKLVSVNPDKSTNELYLKATCPCCKGENPEIVSPVIIGRCKQTAENNLCNKIFSLLKNNYIIIDNNGNILQFPENIEIKTA